MKRKRVGAGQRGSSNPYTVAKDLLQHSESAAPSHEGSAGDQEASSAITSSAVTSTIRARATVAASSLGSPTKTGKATSRKQQKLAEAAKTSRDISLYFAKKEMPAISKAPPPEQPPELDDGSWMLSPGGRSPASSETAAVRTDIVTVPDDEEEEKGKDDVGAHKSQTLEWEEAQDKGTASVSE